MSLHLIWLKQAVSTVWVACCKSASFKIFVVVIPKSKERLAGRAPPILVFVWHWLYNIICEGCKLQIYSRCHTKRRMAGRAPPILLLKQNWLVSFISALRITKFMGVGDITLTRSRYSCVWCHHLIGAERTTLFQLCPQEFPESHSICKVSSILFSIHQDLGRCHTRRGVGEKTEGQVQKKKWPQSVTLGSKNNLPWPHFFLSYPQHQ